MSLPRYASSLLLVFGIALSPPAFAGGSGDPIAIVSARSGVPASQLSVVGSAAADYPLLAMQAQLFKVEAADGETYRVALDASGAEVDPDALEAQEASRYETTYGKLDADLYEVARRTPAGERIPVVIWLTAPEGEGIDRPQITSDPTVPQPSPEEIDALYARVDEARAAEVSPLVDRAVSTLEGYGLAAEGDAHAPAVYAEVPVEWLSVAAGLADVARVSLDVEGEPDLAISRPAILGNVVEGRGITGAGVRLAQIEIGGRVAVANPNLRGVGQLGLFVCGTPDAHATGVAGIIASTDPNDRGIAPGATLLAAGSCRGRTFQLQLASLFAVSWGARALNHSYTLGRSGSPNGTDRFLDDIVINRWRTVVKSAGNEAGPCRSRTGVVTNPGLGYNILTVGAFDPNFSAAWGDDFMEPCSSWRNPRSRHGDREKPEVAAPGANVWSTINGFPWIGFFGSGTSAAAPMATAATALLIQRNGFFSVWPETVKAVLMATALNNIEGNARLSEFDGAGGLALDRADDVARGALGGFGGRSYTCSASRNLDVATFFLTAGTRTRAVIAWDTSPGYLFYGRQPGADLDLRLIAPNGATVAASLSWDGSTEIVDVVPPTSGFYRLRVNKFRCSSSPRWLGWSWYQGP